MKVLRYACIAILFGLSACASHHESMDGKSCSGAHSEMKCDSCAAGGDCKCGGDHKEGCGAHKEGCGCGGGCSEGK